MTPLEGSSRETPPGGTADPNHAARARNDGADLGSGEPVSLGPHSRHFAIRPDSLQSVFRTDPEDPRAVAMNGLEVAAREAFRAGPRFPLFVTQPASETGAREANPNGTLAVFEDATGGIDGKPLIDPHGFPPARGQAAQPGFRGHEQTPVAIQVERGGYSGARHTMGRR